MQYVNMLSYQVREAIKNNSPVLFPLGVIEYHAEHLPLGTDSFVAIEACRRFEARHPEAVILPPFYYGSASYAVAPGENNGTIQVDSKNLIPVAEDIFRSLLRVGFRNIHCFIAHQTEEFVQGMPTDLAFRFAARHTIFEFLEKESGEGWWGNEKFSNYYSGNNNPFAWIKVYPCAPTKEREKDFCGDHAGPMETSLDLTICPEFVEMDRIDQNIWFARESGSATAEHGDDALESVVDQMERLIYAK